MKTITEKSIKFLLKETSADKPTLILVFFRYDNTRFVSSMGQSNPSTLLTYLDRMIVDAKAGKRLTNKSRRYAPLNIKAFGRLNNM